MALEDLVKGKDIPKPINSSNLINQGKDVSSLNSPRGRHLDNGRDVLPQGSPIGRHINSGNTILPTGGLRGRHTQSPLGNGSLRKSPLAGE
tara:strand:+ start:329 stop:601 length:273 start_codon:yes stop_codon:yes gene_type:complete